MRKINGHKINSTKKIYKRLHKNWSTCRKIWAESPATNEALQMLLGADKMLKSLGFTEEELEEWITINK